MKHIDKIVKVDPARPGDAPIARAADIVRSGGVVVFPTYGLYGLGADPFNPQAVQRIFDIKGRQAHKAILLLIADFRDLDRVAMPPGPMALNLMQRFWPGKVTFVVPARKQLPRILLGKGAKIGVRLAAHPVAAALVRSFASALTGTSANISGAGGCNDIRQIDAGLLEQVDLVLDAGPLAGGPGSTVVDVSGETPLILRQGAVDADDIMAVFNA